MTRRQLDLLNFLRRWFAEHEHGPSYQDIIAGSCFRSKGHLQVTLKRLEAHGRITMIPSRARSIRLVNNGDGRDTGRWTPLGEAARRVLASIAFEDPDAGMAVVSSDALGDLDLALAEREAT